jgi:hypothetical protein
VRGHQVTESVQVVEEPQLVQEEDIEIRDERPQTSYASITWGRARDTRGGEESVGAVLEHEVSQVDVQEPQVVEEQVEIVQEPVQQEQVEVVEQEAPVVVQEQVVEKWRRPRINYKRPTTT